MGIEKKVKYNPKTAFGNTKLKEQVDKENAELLEEKEKDEARVWGELDFDSRELDWQCCFCQFTNDTRLSRAEMESGPNADWRQCENCEKNNWVEIDYE